MIIIVFFIFTTEISASSLLVLEESHGKYKLDSYIDMLEDKDKKLSIHDILQPDISNSFTPNREGTDLNRHVIF